MLLGVEKTSASHQTLTLQIIGLQLALIIISAGVVYVMDTSQSGISVLWGGGCALLNVCLLKWRMRLGDDRSISENRHLILMYRSALERFFVVLGLLAFGMMRLDLAPLAILLGFVVGQAGLILVPLMRGMREISK
ncbi:MAG: ATP synthase subunit I [Methylophilaceae bacterium]